VRVVADGTPHRITVHGHDGRPVGHVTAVGHATPREREDLSRRFPRPEGDLPEVALLHTQVHASSGSEAHDAYAPSELAFLIRAGYDYWALGHVHVRQTLSPDPPVVYPGSLQGRTHTDTGPRGAYLVDLADRTAPALSFRALAPVSWATLRVGGLEEADSLDRLERRIASLWRSSGSGEPGASAPEWMLRVVLEGPSPLWKELRTEEDRQLLAHELRELLGVLDVVVLAEGVHPLLPVDEHRRRIDVLGEALRLMGAVARGEASLSGVEPASLASLTSEDPRALDSLVRGLLDGAEGELAARLLGLDSGGA
jgi:DNA repair exonuclease SbcCD nuclease subunit